MPSWLNMMLAGDLLGVQGFERREQRDRELDGLARRHLVLLQSGFERFAVDVLEADAEAIVDLADLVDRDDVRMRDRRHRPRFAKEAFRDLLLAVLERLQELQRDRSLEVRIERLVHDAVSAGPDLLAQLVVSDTLLGHRGSSSPSRPC